MDERSLLPMPMPEGGSGAVFAHPDAVICDSHLTPDAKRAILASWASDAHAVENEPKLRRLESGALVELDEILGALASLHNVGDAPATAPPKRLSSPAERGTHAFARWLIKALRPAQSRFDRRLSKPAGCYRRRDLVVPGNDR